jgi:hypothetical protein
MPNFQAKVIEDAPILVDVIAQGKVTDLWRSWFKQITAQLNRTSPVTQGGSRAVQTLTPGASPWTFQSPFGGDVRLLVSGGTVSSIQFSRDNVTYYPVGVTAGQITLSQNDFLKITYTVVPTVTAVPA